MECKKAAEIISIARAEAEWEYPIEYAAAFDAAEEALHKCDKIQQVVWAGEADAIVNLVKELFIGVGK